MKVKGVQIEAYPTMESLTFDFGGRDPDPNAMYLLTLGGLRVLHIGDVGNPISEHNLQALRGKVDVMFALTGGHATIALEDLDAAIAAIQPRVVIPMHYYSPRGVLKILPVDEFTKRYPCGGRDLCGRQRIDTEPRDAAAAHAYLCAGAVALVHRMRNRGSGLSI
jgi:L-ascorbate metabolism protein UlaG (beta-lactamase superfamily)